MPSAEWWHFVAVSIQQFSMSLNGLQGACKLDTTGKNMKEDKKCHGTERWAWRTPCENCREQEKQAAAGKKHYGTTTSAPALLLPMDTTPASSLAPFPKLPKKFPCICKFSCSSFSNTLPSISSNIHTGTASRNAAQTAGDTDC